MFMQSMAQLAPHVADVIASGNQEPCHENSMGDVVVTGAMALALYGAVTLGAAELAFNSFLSRRFNDVPHFLRHDPTSASYRPHDIRDRWITRGIAAVTIGPIPSAILISSELHPFHNCS